MNTPSSEAPDPLNRPERGLDPPSIGYVSPLVALVVGLVLGGAVAATVVLGTRRDFGAPRPDPQVLVLPED